MLASSGSAGVASGSADPTASGTKPLSGESHSRKRHSPGPSGSSGSKKRTSPAPTNSNDRTSPMPDVLLQSAVVQASQVCTKMGYHGLAHLLMSRSTSSAASLAVGTSSNNSAAASSSSIPTTSPALPTIAQVQQAATKAHNEQPPWIHWSKNDMSTSSMRVTSNHRLELQANLPTARNVNPGYRMARANVGCSAGSYYFELWYLEPPPTTMEIVQSLPANVRLSDKLRASLRAALEYQEQQQQTPPTPKQQSLQKQASSTSVKSELTTTGDDGSEEGSEEPPAAKRTKTETTSGDSAEASAPPEVESAATGNNNPIESNNNNNEPPRVGGHIRLGWSMRTADLSAPVGYDRWSFGIRDTGGSIVTNSQRMDNWIGAEGFGPGDVIGCSISLYNRNEEDEDDDARATSSHHHNHIRFFKNGICMGEFVVTKGKRSGGEAPFPCEIPAGIYFPAVSCYMGGSVRANFGPRWVYPPKKLPAGLKLSPMCELSPAPETNAQTVLSQMTPIFKMLRNGGSKHVETFQQVMQQCVATEARILKQMFENYQQQNLSEIRQERLDRGLAVQDIDTLLEEGLQEPS